MQVNAFVPLSLTLGIMLALTTADIVSHSEYNLSPVSRTIRPKSVYKDAVQVFNPEAQTADFAGTTVLTGQSYVTYDFGVNIGGLVSTWSYISWDGPDFRIGNGLNLAAASMILVIGLLGLCWMKWDNRRRERRDVEGELAGLSEREVGDLDWKHPDFRWQP